MHQQSATLVQLVSRMCGTCVLPQPGIVQMAQLNKFITFIKCCKKINNDLCYHTNYCKCSIHTSSSQTVWQHCSTISCTVHFNCLLTICSVAIDRVDVVYNKCNYSSSLQTYFLT